MKRVFLGTSLAIGLISGLAGIPAQAATVPTTSGSLIRFAGEPDIYVLTNGKLYWMPSAALFNAADDNWHDVITIPDDAPRPPIGGTLLVYTNSANEQAGSPTTAPSVVPLWLYNVHSQTLYQWPTDGTVANDPWFTTVLSENDIAANPPVAMVTVLGTAGETFGTVTDPLPIPLTPWPSNPQTVSFKSHETSTGGVTYKLSGSNRVYWASGGTLHWIPNAATFTAAGCAWNRVQTMSHFTAPIGYPVLVRDRTAPQVYVEGTQAVHWVPSATQLAADGFRWADVLTDSHLPEPVGIPWTIPPA